MLEKKKLMAEKLRIIAARAEMDYLIEQKMDEVRRLQEAMARQDAAEKSVLEKIKELEEKVG